MTTTYTTNILWLSRHELTPEQLAALTNMSRRHKSMSISHMNVTFAADGENATNQILALANEHKADSIAGVFPAHVAARLACRLREYGNEHLPVLYIPVSVPAPAAEGETRGGGFVFSHWEMF